jgi:hypothetical protein
MSVQPPTDTRDRVMWLFAMIAGCLLVGGVVLVAILALVRPEINMDEIGKALNTQLSLIVGAVLGYAARGPSTNQPDPPGGDQERSH